MQWSEDGETLYWIFILFIYSLSVRRLEGPLLKWNIILNIYLFIIGTAIRGASVKVKHCIKYFFYLLSVRRLEGPLLKWNIILNIYFIYLFIIGTAIRGASVIGVLYWWVFVPQEGALKAGPYHLFILFLFF